MTHDPTHDAETDAIAWVAATVLVPF